MFTLRNQITAALLLSLLLMSLPAMATRRGGNGPGNGTDELAGEIALKSLMDARDGLSIEEKIYNLWVKAENAVPRIDDPKFATIWFGLNVVNQGAQSRWGDVDDRIPMEKFQKGFLRLRSVPAIKMGGFEIKPAQVFGSYIRTGNFDGNMDPADTWAGRIGVGVRLLDCPLEGRSDLGGSEECLMKPLQVTPSGVVVQSVEKDVKHTIEFRQLDADTLVGVRKALPGGDPSVKPCLESRAVYRKENREVEETRNLLGVRYGAKVPKEVQVFDHWENAKDYGVPGVCEVYYLVKSALK